ncbi:DUF29 domain-containing protein [Allochromatium humboldtianum]|uniref:DUF29 domain-containing protein n=1 Tax=Allochromatium humboldtianum TaxID=504901 RepID=A0A850RE31_9GAMM|nr:DUF29 domain-containing protein [Allochromatium humboldtianum]NVZ11205.1 DUF29 domain-containing protein [Allochromatium humboldtianum]
MHIENTKLHDVDFHAWTQQQADLLKTRNWSEVDIDGLIEEIESMGARERRELINRLAVLLAHLLKWQYQPSFRGRSWQLTLKEQRRRLQRLLRENPSLQARIADFIEDAYGDAILLAAKETGLDENSFPNNCPYLESEILNPDFHPN